MIKALTAIALFLFVWPVRVAANNCAGNIGGMFANGAYFCGTYDKSFVVVTGGQKVEREKFDLNVNYKGVSKNLTYVYDSDGPSQIKSNPLGFISITTHAGSMDGDIISAYVFF